MNEALRKHFEGQAQGCEMLGSPFTAKLCRTLIEVLDESTTTGRRVLNWPGDARDDALALRLCGTLHRVVLSGVDAELAAAYPPRGKGDGLATVLPGAIRRNDGEIAAGLDSAPQTNEIARAAMLLPGFLAVARETGLPLDLHEIGASAGLNLLFDRFHYSYGADQWGDGTSPVRLAPEVRGGSVPLAGTLVIAGRRGADIAPVRVTDAAARLRLRSYIWADQPARLERLDAAIRLAEEEASVLEKMDAADFVEAALARRRKGSVFVLFHSIMWQYMPAERRKRIEEALAAAGKAASRDAPIAWLRMEPVSLKDPFATLLLTSWPDGETRRLAHCDYHGRWIEWLDPQPVGKGGVLL